jgi:hypothetical protein
MKQIHDAGIKLGIEIGNKQAQATAQASQETRLEDLYVQLGGRI